MFLQGICRHCRQNLVRKGVGLDIDVYQAFIAFQRLRFNSFLNVTDPLVEPGTQCHGFFPVSVFFEFCQKGFAFTHGFIAGYFTYEGLTLSDR